MVERRGPCPTTQTGRTDQLGIWCSRRTGNSALVQRGVARSNIAAWLWEHSAPLGQGRWEDGTKGCCSTGGLDSFELTMATDMSIRNWERPHWAHRALIWSWCRWPLVAHCRSILVLTSPVVLVNHRSQPGPFRPLALSQGKPRTQVYPNFCH